MHCVGSSLCVNLSEPRCYTGNCCKKYLHYQNASVKTEKIWGFFMTWLFKHSSKNPKAGVLIQHNIILQFNYLLHWERHPCHWHRACSGLVSDYCIFKNTPVWLVCNPPVLFASSSNVFFGLATIFDLMETFSYLVLVSKQEVWADFATKWAVSLWGDAGPKSTKILLHQINLECQ